jgi:hypothetical protein
MSLTDQDAGYIRALIYPVQFDRHPVDGVDRVIAMINARGVLNAKPDDLLKIIQIALHSEVELAKLIPQPHREELIREYLSEIERHLQVVIDPKVRQNRPQRSNFAFKVRSTQKPHG